MESNTRTVTPADTNATTEEAKTNKNNQANKMRSVEQIIHKATASNGKIFYRLKWCNFDDKYNTWEPIENLDCPELIEAYEKRHSDEKEERLTIASILGFARGLPPKEILAATNDMPGGELFYLMKWQGAKDCDLVPATEAARRCPDLVFQFLEGRVVHPPGIGGERSKVIVKRITKLKQKTDLKILGAAGDTHGKLILVIIYKGLERPVPLRLDQAKKEIPLMVIDFFQRNLRWGDDDDAKEIMK